MIKEILNYPYQERVSSGKFSISNIGQCWRKVYLQMKGLYKDEFTESTKRLFNVGNLIHREVVKELIEKGHANKLHVVAAEVGIPEHPRINGRIDIVVSDGKDLYILDVKSAGLWTMNMIKKGTCPVEYLYQVQLYMYFTGIHKGYLVFVGKDKSEVEEVEVKYDEALCLRLIKDIDDFFDKYIVPGIEPPYCKNRRFKCIVCKR